MTEAREPHEPETGEDISRRLLAQMYAMLTRGQEIGNPLPEASGGEVSVQVPPPR